jgi:hypothetical protein
MSFDRSEEQKPELVGTFNIFFFFFFFCYCRCFNVVCGLTNFDVFFSRRDVVGVDCRCCCLATIDIRCNFERLKSKSSSVLNTQQE